MNILVTGGAGYIGSVLVNELLDKNHNVSVIDNLKYNQFSLQQNCINQNFDFIKGDVFDFMSDQKFLSKFDIIIPLAALVGAPICEKNKELAYDINYNSILSLINSISKNQIVIMPVSNSGYGISNKRELCDENSPLNPISIYGKSKVDAEKVIMDRDNSISLRLATVFGMSPRMRLDLIVNNFVYKAITDNYLVIFEGHFRRNFIHIKDVSNAFIHSIENFSLMKNNIFNVGNDSANMTKIELANLIHKIYPKFTIIENDIGSDPDKRDYLVSNEKINRTGFKCKFSLEVGVSELLKGINLIPSTHFSNI